MWAQFDQLTIIDDVLVRRLEELKTKLQVLVPMTERMTILSHYHLCFPNLDQIHIVYMGCDWTHRHFDAVYMDDV
jgi:hypothetical protein